MPPIIGVYDSHVRLYESSAADGPHVWLAITSNKKNYDDCHPSLTAHLELTELVKLGEQIDWLKKHHYQGGIIDPARTPWWRKLLRLDRGNHDG